MSELSLRSCFELRKHLSPVAVIENVFFRKIRPVSKHKGLIRDDRRIVRQLGRLKLDLLGKLLGERLGLALVLLLAGSAVEIEFLDARLAEGKPLIRPESPAGELGEHRHEASADTENCYDVVGEDSGQHAGVGLEQVDSDQAVHSVIG